MATYAVSDLHGQYGLFNRLLETIDFSDDDFMYVLGDAIDRGADGIKILQKIMDTKNMDLLIGNHEFLMLSSIALDGSVDTVPGKDATLWLDFNGGNKTFSQYETLSPEKRKELLAWLNTRKLTTLVNVGEKTFCLTHSFFIEDCIDKKYEDCDYNDIWNTVWDTPYRPDLYVPVSTYSEKGWDFIIGHVPVQRVVGPLVELHVYHEQNIHLIDGGCSFRGRSAIPDDRYGVICIRLEDMQETVITFASDQLK